MSAGRNAASGGAPHGLVRVLLLPYMENKRKCQIELPRRGAGGKRASRRLTTKRSTKEKTLELTVLLDPTAAVLEKHIDLIAAGPRSHTTNTTQDAHPAIH